MSCIDCEDCLKITRPLPDCFGGKLIIYHCSVEDPGPDPGDGFPIKICFTKNPGTTMCIDGFTELQSGGFIPIHVDFSGFTPEQLDFFNVWVGPIQMRIYDACDDCGLNGADLGAPIVLIDENEVETECVTLQIQSGLEIGGDIPLVFVE